MDKILPLRIHLAWEGVSVSNNAEQQKALDYVFNIEYVTKCLRPLKRVRGSASLKGVRMKTLKDILLKVFFPNPRNNARPN